MASSLPLTAAIEAGPAESGELEAEQYPQYSYDDASSGQCGGRYRNVFDMILMVLTVERVDSWPVAIPETSRSSSE